MNVAALLKRFDIIADQAANIPALRRLIVDLAVRGKLLPGDLAIDAQGMLNRISAKASEVLLKGGANKLSLNPTIGDDEIPAAYLSHCAFARLGTIANLQRGLTGIQNSTPGEFPLVVTSAVRGTSDHFDFDGAAAIIPLVSSTGHGNASINRLHYQEGKFALGTILCAAFPFDESLISARFLYEYLTAFKEELLVSKMVGTANVSLTLRKIADVPVPILSPEIQRHVDELMTLCDQLEATQIERERSRDRLVLASLQRLNQSALNTTPKEQSAYARFYLDHISRLATRPDHIKELRQTIFNLAVRGLLVAQDGAEEPAVALLNKIRQKKASVVKTGGVPREKTASRKALLSFPIPKNWQAVYLGDVCDFVTSGSRGWAAFYAENGPKFLRAQNIRFGRLRLDDIACVNPPVKSEGARTQVQLGDILIVITGAGVTNPALLDRDLGEAYVSQHVALVRPTETALSKWLLLCLMSGPGGRDELVENAYGAGKPGLNLYNIRSLNVPIPPLAEQHRIVAKVEELIDLCDQIEALLTSVQADSSSLLEKLLDKVPKVVRVSSKLKSVGTAHTRVSELHEAGKESRFMTKNPASTVDHLLACIDHLGGSTTPERLLIQTGLSEDVEAFYDLIRAARDSGKLNVPFGARAEIRRIVDAN